MGDAVLPATEMVGGGAVALCGVATIAGLAGAAAGVVVAWPLVAITDGAAVAAGIAAGRGGASGDRVATGAGRGVGALATGVELVTGVAAMVAALRAGIGAIGSWCCAAGRGSPVALGRCGAGVSGGGTGIGDGGVGCGCAGGIAALSMTACESRADAGSTGVVTALLRVRRGAAGASDGVAFGFAGARLRGATASAVTFTLFFGAARWRTGFGGAAASPDAPGSTLATLDLRRRGGCGGSTSCMSRV